MASSKTNIKWEADLVSDDVVTVRGSIRAKEFDVVIAHTLDLKSVSR